MTLYARIFSPWLLGGFLLMLPACAGLEPQEAPPPAYRIIGYAFGANGMDMSPAAVRMLTHVNYAFANVQPDGNVILERPQDAANLERLVALKQYNPDLKILLSIGGWGWSDYFSNAALTDASRERFARSATALVEEHHLDGLDIDWEYPGQRGEDNIFREEDRENFTLLLAETRAHLRDLREGSGRDEPFLLTIAAGAGAAFLAHTEMDEAARYLDFINLMTYDFHGSWSPRTGHLANLFSPADSIISGAASVDLFLEAGVPAEKLVLGVPFYARGWYVQHRDNQGLYQPVEEYAGGYSYETLATRYVDSSGFTQHWDEAAEAPFLWNADSSLFITYENKRSLTRKAAFVRARGLGGIMYWEQSSDTPQHTLLSTIYEGLYSVLPPLSAAPSEEGDEMYVRLNLVGYLSEDPKVAIAFANDAVEGEFIVVDSARKEVVFAGRLNPIEAEGWGAFDHFYELDFSPVTASGRYYVRVKATDDQSPIFSIGPNAYGEYQEDLVAFMRQQRCGYNPFLDAVCHQRDGRSAYGPMPDSTFIDAAGGWHDAGDQLKYLLTGSNATANLLLAYLLDPDKFGDEVDALGHPRPNGTPDVLDEARWGLRWMHKLHPKPAQLFHQVADDRDHIGWKLPGREDPSDYGWGPDSYRVVYYANGEPQGLGGYLSSSDGVANLAGRYAAAMAMAYRIWEERDPVFAEKSLRAAEDVYRLGKKDPGVQQGNSYGSPYRYGEITWADDMEWGAAALYAATGEAHYLADAKDYARRIGATSWIPRDTAAHYAYYPFVNVGHFALYPHVDEAFQDTLAEYYRAGLERARRRGRTNSYRIGVPFIWCSNNLASALITQGLLYEQMTGDSTYHAFIIAQRDWLLGRNPWGTSMFTGIPHGGEYPVDVHTSIWALTGREAPGGLVDGPVYATIYNSLAGITLTEPDEFSRFQTEYVVYHDDRGDYSTNEPTMDGTATAVPWMAHFGAPDGSN